jgi:hypothetical protein
MFPWHLAIYLYGEVIDQQEPCVRVIRFVSQIVRLPGVSPEVCSRIAEEKCFPSFVAKLVYQFNTMFQWPLIYLAQSLTSALRHVATDLARVHVVDARPPTLSLRDQVHETKTVEIDEEIMTSIECVEYPDAEVAQEKSESFGKEFEKIARRMPLFEVILTRLLAGLQELAAAKKQELPLFYYRRLVKAWLRLELEGAYRLMLMQ